MPSPEAPLAGSCACGTVRFQVTAEFKTAGYCHCTRCQRRAGVPWSMNGMVGDERLARSSPATTSVRYWRPPDGLPKAFCEVCGGHVWSGEPGVRRRRRRALRGAARRPGDRAAVAPVAGVGAGLVPDPGRRAAALHRQRADREVEHRELGASGLSVSVLALGSWRTWERIPRADAVATLGAAREAGIDFLDTARYHDAAGLLRGRVRRDLPGVGVAARRGDDRQQAVVGVLAGAERRGGARRVAATHRARPFRRHLLRPATDRAGDVRGRERGRRTCSGPGRRGRGPS